MKNEDKTKEQLIAELTDLQQKFKEFELTQNIQNNISKASDLSLPYRQFSTGPAESFTINRPAEPSVNSSLKYGISDLVDIPLVHDMAASLYKVTGIPHALLDVDNNILSAIGWSDICVRFHRVCPQTQNRCRQSDSYIANHFQDGPYVAYKCLNGLMDYATPIIIDGQHLATLFIGQFLHQPPDEEFFRRQAREYGFDETAYLEALNRVPIIPEEQIENIMGFFVQASRFLAALRLERKRQLEAVTQSEQKFSRFFNCNPDVMAITTLREGRYVAVNDAFVEITGYERDEVIGHTSKELDTWADAEQRDIVIQQAREYGNVRNIEVKFRMKSGDIQSFMTSCEIIDLDGEEHIIVTVKDITERIRMEEELRLSEECFSKAFNASPVSMTISALKDGRFIKINNAYCNIVGFSREEAIGRTSLELGFWADPADRNLIKQQIRANQSVQDLEIKFYKGTGELRMGLLSAEGIDVHGQQCILCTLTDITDLKQMEVEMTRLDRLNLVGEMAASIGHEIRNPMTTVRGYLQLLQQNEDYSPEAEYFDLMIEELDRANSIITEFLSLAKDKAVDLSRGNLNPVISRSFPLIRAKAMSRDQYVKLELNELPDILLDKKGIRQLIFNLVNNGLEAMPSDRNVIIRTFVENENVVLAIQDEGHGIDSSLLGKLGTPFFTTKDQGTGLGLAVCYRIATRHNAKIDIDTSANGTTFYVKFPI